MGVSAIWHGFYPYYYYMFFLCALLVEVSKDIYRARILLSFIPEPLRHPLGNFFTMLALNYMGTSFGLLSFEKGGNLAKGTNYVVLIAVVSILVLIKSLGLVKYAKNMERKRDESKIKRSE